MIWGYPYFWKYPHIALRAAFEGETRHVFPTVEAGASGPATTWSSSDLVLHWTQCPLAILNRCTCIDLPIATGGSSKKQVRKQEQKQTKRHQSQALDRWMVAKTCWCLNVYHFTQRACLFFIIFHLRHIVVFQRKDVGHNKSCNWGDLHLLRIFVQVDVKIHSPFSFCLSVPISVSPALSCLPRLHPTCFIWE